MESPFRNPSPPPEEESDSTNQLESQEARNEILSALLREIRDIVNGPEDIWDTDATAPQEAQEAPVSDPRGVGQIIAEEPKKPVVEEEEPLLHRKLNYVWDLSTDADYAQSFKERAPLLLILLISMLANNPEGRKLEILAGIVANLVPILGTKEILV